MGKEKLSFKINNRSVVYEGYVEHRPKDLMEVLAKLGVDEGIVVSTFRSNIEDNSGFDDAEILSMFNSAKAARAEKKARQQRADAAPPPPAPSSAHGSRHVDANAGAPQEEVKTRISLSFKGTNFQYMGYPSAKRNAVLQLLVKQRDELTYPLAIETFRANLPDVTVPDSQIWSEISNAIQAKTGSPPAFPGPESQESGRAQEEDDEDLMDAINKYNAIPKEEHDEIRGFIRQVLENPEDDALPPPNTGTRTAVAGAGVDEAFDKSYNQQQYGRYTAAGGRVAIYCQETGDKTSTTKVIYASPDVTFEEFKGMVARKYGREMALSFEEGDDVVEVDDDDVLSMFFELLQQNNKKMKLICSKPRRSQQVSLANDSRSAEQEKDTAVKPKAVESFSNGDLEVSLEKTFTGHKEAVYSCAFSLAGDRFVSASRDRSVRVWNVNGKSETLLMKGGHNDWALSCDFSPQSTRVVSSSRSRELKVWNTRTCSKAASLKGHTDKVYCVEYSPNGDYIVSSSFDNSIRVWNTEKFSKEATLKGHTLAVFSCGFSKNDGGIRVVSGSDDQLVKIWKWKDQKEERSLKGHKGTIWSVAFSHNDKHIVSASMDCELFIWLADTGEHLRTLTGHTLPIHHAIFSPTDKYVLSCSKDCSVRVWRVEDGELVETIVAHGSTIYQISVHGENILTASLDTTLKLWKLKNLLS